MLIYNINCFISYLLDCDMYRHEIYLRKLQEELKRILQMNKGCLTVSSVNNPFYSAANLMTGFGKRLAAELLNKKDKTSS